MALVLAETAAGVAAILFLTPMWREVKRGFFYLTGGVVLALAAGTAAATAAGFDPDLAPEGTLAITLSLALTGATLLWMGLMLVKSLGLARVVGIATVPLAGAMLWAFARATGESLSLSFFQLLAGALFTGAVLDGLLLGHWYLTDRKLPRGPILRMAWLLIAAVAVEALALLVGGLGESAGPGSSTSGSLNPLLSLAGTASWIALGMVACTGLIGVFIFLALRGSRPTAVQSATGFFYLAVITAFWAELTAKLRFLP